MASEKKKSTPLRQCLLVSTSPELCDAFRNMAEALNLTVTCINKAEDAPQASSKHPIRCVIIDIRDNRLESLEALHYFRSGEYKVPILMITAHADQESVGRYAALGAHACLGWPADSENIASALRHLIGRVDAAEEGSTDQSRSISAMGTWRRFILAIFLISILPLLALIYLVVNPDQGVRLDEDAPRAVLMIDIMFMVFGYGLLAAYPINVVRLRRYLEAMARGSMPEKVDLMKEENDLAAIESCMKTVVNQTQQRIKTVEAQTQALIQAERQRVMFESLGAACHHLGQPATVIDLYLAMIEKDITNPETHDMLLRCQESSKEIAGILRKLQTMTQYQTEYYRGLDESDMPLPDARIIKI